MAQLADRIKISLASSSGSWSPLGESDPLFTMLECATHALHAEDLTLRASLVAGRERFPGALENVSCGLAYWVFETGLVYTIFKSWLPRMAVRWEHPYSATSTKAADLVLFPSPQEGWVFEAKWWNANNEKVRKIVLADAEKLRENDLTFMSNPIGSKGTPTTWRRFLMTFSWGDSGELEVDWAPFESFLSNANGLVLRFVGAFPTDVYKTWGPPSGRRRISTGYFAMTVLELAEPHP